MKKHNQKFTKAPMMIKIFKVSFLALNFYIRRQTFSLVYKSKDHHKTRTQIELVDLFTNFKQNLSQRSGFPTQSKGFLQRKSAKAPSFSHRNHTSFFWPPNKKLSAPNYLPKHLICRLDWKLR
uniref:Uncharacterized protein n=1 Tax=Arundo donax TaxID=35708 RepID=A0A0A9E219_ARUDO